MKFSYMPHGVCSRQFNFDIEDGVVRSVEIIGGCPGNLEGISRLLAGMKVDDVIERLRGVRCGMKPTSCPDQIARALEAQRG